MGVLGSNLRSDVLLEDDLLFDGVEHGHEFGDLLLVFEFTDAQRVVFLLELESGLAFFEEHELGWGREVL